MRGEGEDDEGDRDGHRPGPPGRPTPATARRRCGRRPPAAPAALEAGRRRAGSWRTGARPATGAGRERDAGSSTSPATPGRPRRPTGRRTPRRARTTTRRPDREHDPERRSGGARLPSRAGQAGRRRGRVRGESPTAQSGGAPPLRRSSAGRPPGSAGPSRAGRRRGPDPRRRAAPRRQSQPLGVLRMPPRTAVGSGDQTSSPSSKDNSSASGFGVEVDRLTCSSGRRWRSATRPAAPTAADQPRWSSRPSARTPRPPKTAGTHSIAPGPPSQWPTEYQADGPITNCGCTLGCAAVPVW